MEVIFTVEHYREKHTMNKSPRSFIIMKQRIKAQRALCFRVSSSLPFMGSCNKRASQCISLSSPFCYIHSGALMDLNTCSSCLSDVQSFRNRRLCISVRDAILTMVGYYIHSIISVFVFGPASFLEMIKKMSKILNSSQQRLCFSPLRS